MRGKLTLTAAKTYTDTNHPRGCGENSASIFISARPRGSPPRMRGKPKVCIYMRRRERITPADAGKTYWRTDRSTASWDHPRGCGENDAVLRIPFNTSGSPPRMRGKRSRFRINDCCVRITPADAGKTCFSVAGAEPQRDHPRGCGENAHNNRSGN